MVDNSSDLTYLHLTRNTIQEETLAVNQPLKYGMSHLELKFIDTMHKMEYFLNNLSDHQFSIPTRQ